MSATRSPLPPAPVPGDGRVPAPASRPHVVRRAVRAAAPLLTAGVSAVAVWATWRVFVVTDHGQSVDQAALEGAHIGQGRLWQIAEPVLDVVSVGFIAVAVLACAVIAVVRRRWGLALAAALVLGGASLTTRVLKNVVLDRPDLGHGPDFNTLPSGHTTAAASVAAAVVLVVPPRARPWAAVLGAAYAAATGVSTLVGQWHRPSDVVAGLLVVLFWAALACVLPALGIDPTGGDRHPPTAAVPVAGGVRPGRGAGAQRVGTAVLLVAAVAAGVPALLALRSTWTDPDPLATRAGLLTSYGGGALGVIAATALVFAVLLVLRGSVTGSVRARPTS